MQEVLVAVFDTAPRAQQAVDALKAAGIGEPAIRRYKDNAHRSSGRSDQASSPAPRVEGGGFWAWLLGEEGDGGYYPEYERAAYDRAIGPDNEVVAVTVDEARGRDVMSILTEHSPVELVLKEAGSSTATGTRQGGAVSAASATNRSIRSASGKADGGAAETEESIPLSEEQVSVGKRQVDRGTTRVRRYVVKEPVERQVTLKDEHVEIERRRPMSGSTGDSTFEERIIEVHETTEEPVVTKTSRPVEEVVVRKTTTQRPETVREEVRKEKVEIQKPR